MKKINTLLKLNDEELKELENKIIRIISEVNKIDRVMKPSYIRIALEFLYPILSLTNNLEVSLKMMKVALKFRAFGRRDKEALDLVVNYYCINKIGFFKDELEEMIEWNHY